jgi:hypothetical protein
MKKFCFLEIDHDNISEDTNPLFEKGLSQHVNKRIETRGLKCGKREPMQLLTNQ